ncbi:MAG: sporulation protein YtxC [bacterium]|jgi:putative sporulation protein YtxC
MALPISVASLQSPAALRQRVTEEIEYLRQQGLAVSMCEIERGQLTFIGCNVEKSEIPMLEEEAGVLLRSFLAKALADIIITHCEENLVRKWVQEEYSNFSAEEQRKIIALTLENNRLGMGKVLDRHTQIVSRLVEYLKCCNTIIVEGFVRFRLQDYQRELREAISYAAGDVEGEKEYQEFIQLLRYFVSLQDPRWPVVQVLPKANGSYQLLDENNQRLVLCDLWGNSDGYEDLSQDDLLISALVCMSPVSIVLHKDLVSGKLTSEMENTIKDIFSGRVSFCQGCKFCQKDY